MRFRTSGSCSAASRKRILHSDGSRMKLNLNLNRPRNRRLASAPAAGAKPAHFSGRQAAAAALLVFAGIGLLQAAGFMERLEWLAGDGLKQLEAAGQKPRPDLHFVVLDQRSLDAAAADFGLSWPWPREAYARAVHYLRQSGARAVLFDFLFSESSQSGVEDDRSLAGALQDAGNVYLPVLAKPAGAENAVERLLAEQPGSALRVGAGPGVRLPDNRSLSLPVAPILSSAAGCGDVRFVPDADGVIRRLPPMAAAGGATVPAFGLAPLLQRENGRIMLESGRLRIGDRTWPLDARGNLVLRFPGSWRAYPRTSLIDVIISDQALSEGSEPAVPAETFKDKIVIIGSIAEGLWDLRKTPLEAATPGFYISAALWAAGESGRAYDERWRPVLAWVLLLLLSILGAVWGGQPFARGLALAGLTLAAFLGAVGWLFFAQGVIIDAVAPTLGLLSGYGLSLALSYRREQRQKRFIQSAFTQVLSPSVLDGLMRDPKRLSAGGELAELTVYFSDLAGFTSFSEKLPPHQLVEVLNLYLGEMIATIVDEQDGYVDKFIGDAVMAFWGAPMPQPDHAARACFAALRNQERLQALQGRLKAMGLDAPLSMRIGIHTGGAVVGMMGSPKKLNYTVIGDTVNLASRLESVNKQFGTQILISGETMSRVRGRVVAREVDRIRVKGKTLPTRIFELVGTPGRVPETVLRCLRAYEQGSDLYFQGKFEAALPHFERALEARPEDKPSQILRDRCREYISRPPCDWDGVTTLTNK